MEQSPHVVLLPTPGMGHLIPLVELAKRLVLLHGFSATFLVPGDAPLSKAQKAFLDDLPAPVRYRLLPLADTSDLPPDAKIETRMCVMLHRSLPSIRDSLRSLLSTHRVVAYVSDLFGFESLGVASDFNVSPYIFFPSTAMLLSLILYLPELDREVSCEYREMAQPVRIPGSIPLHGRDLLDPVQDRGNDAYKHLLSAEKWYRRSDGIMLNTFHDLEANVIKALQSQENTPPIYPVGPLVRMESESNGLEGSECLDWLDAQPAASVLFVSFGSGGTHSHAQMTELAHGLERSQQRFIWVARSPRDGVADANYFSVYSQNDPLAFLPEGFVDRVKGRGLVLPSWAPQAQILSHGSTGGFLTHCGWNSTLESLVSGVPMIAWPLYAEQRMNAVMLAEGLKVALRPEGSDDKSGLIERDEIARVVIALMEGEEGKGIRSRMKDLKEAAGQVLGEHGSSSKALADVAHKWKAGLKLSDSNPLDRDH